jgi:imidazole glycerol-phosphate synthase subunit HisH
VALCVSPGVLGFFERMITIIDYGMGNLRSVQKALQRIGISTDISSKTEDILAGEKLVLPGVGHFGKAMRTLKDIGMVEALNEAVLRRRIPILGICLGMQLMTEYSEEGDVKGLGWFKAQTSRFSFPKNTLRIPHMGWNQITIKRNGSLFTGIESHDFFYFVHSYFITCQHPEDVVAETIYGNAFVSAFQYENMFGCQFHPEKSHDAGLKILQTFAAL